jgi:hypothetical protein
MANALTANLTPFLINDYFYVIWKLSRTMLAAGWKYMASGNGQSSGCTNVCQTGTAATISSISSNVQTLTGLANLTAGCVGQYITISNANTSGNNGTFLITSFVSATSITVYNSGGTGTDSNNGSLHWVLIRNPATDLWAVGGAVNLKTVSGGGTSSGSVNIGAASSTTGQVTITGVTGFSVNASPGRYVTISGSAVYTTNGNNGWSNNGSFRIVSVSSAGASVTVYAPQLIAESGNASLTVTEQYGGNDGSLTTTTSVTSPGTSTLINFTTSSFTGFTASDVGRRITILGAANVANNNTFTIASYVSSSNVLLYSPSAVASDSNNPNLQWVEVDPLQQTYPYNLQYYSSADHGSGAWINLQGPTTMKIPIGANAVTGTFIRGENLTQSSTGAQGELLGVIQDATGGTGYLVVAPRVIGSGSSGFAGGLYGWNNVSTDTVTGAISGATVTSTAGPPIAYIREYVFWKNTLNTGHIYYQCIDQNASTESATTGITGRFSTMASTVSAVTSQMCPGGASSGTPTTNGFPTTGTLAHYGTGGSGAASTSSSYFIGQYYSGNTQGRSHSMVANNIEQQGISQDGSWVVAQSINASSYCGVAFQRCDNNEDGDLDPYVCVSMGSNAVSNTRTTASNAFAGVDEFTTYANWMSYGTGYVENCRGFYRRGLSTGPQGVGDQFQGFSIALLYVPSEGYPLVFNSNPGYPDRVATAPIVTYVREPAWVVSGGPAGSPRMRKGTLRWMMFTQGMTCNMTTDNLKWVCLSNTQIMMVCGPWDGATVPTF